VTKWFLILESIFQTIQVVHSKKIQNNGLKTNITLSLTQNEGKKALLMTRCLFDLRPKIVKKKTQFFVVKMSLIEMK
jgi:hypothetical protein